MAGLMGDQVVGASPVFNAGFEHRPMSAALGADSASAGLEPIGAIGQGEPSPGQVIAGFAILGGIVFGLAFVARKGFQAGR